MIVISFEAYMGSKICRGRNDYRPYLNAFYIDPEGFIVATDGYRLFCDTAQTSHKDGVLVDVKGKEPAKFSYAEVDLPTKVITFYAVGGAVIAILPVNIVDGRFPDWRWVCNIQLQGVSCVRFTMRYLSDAAKVAKYYGRDTVKFEFQDSASGCRLTLSDTGYMIIMPNRV